ncbi:unnamed protein product [Callosobruchus maculatus]|uniref:Uncharacterized protein n=1 Tax=Callosobruchus maculatus TaxID=64391 RepID=A0A653CPX1_CALMS|nr:unnamed protein product [Callosobruchus maculatus]
MADRTPHTVSPGLPLCPAIQFNLTIGLVRVSKQYPRSR